MGKRGTRVLTLVRNIGVGLKSKHSQGAIEFVIIFAALLAFFIVFFTVIQGNIADKNEERERIVAQNVALNVQSEISLAAEASEGYIREFKVPLNILGKEYNLEIRGGRIAINMTGFSATYKIPEVNGTLNLGSNIIKKQNGKVQIN